MKHPVYILLLLLVLSACGHSPEELAMQTSAAATASAAEWTPMPSIVPSLIPSFTPTVISTEKPTMIPTATKTEKPTKVPSPSLTPTATQEDWGYTCNLEKSQSAFEVEDGKVPSIIEAYIYNDDIYPEIPDICIMGIRESTDFKNKTIGSMLRLEGYSGKELEEQKEAIFKQCEKLSFSIFDIPPPEIDGVTFERVLENGKWVDSILFEKERDQLWLSYDSKTDQCIWKVLH